MDFDLHNPLPQHSLFAMESDHSPATNSDLDSDHLLRRKITSFISHFSDNPFISYLAVNYLHRFIAGHNIPGGKPWILKLVAVACFSLAFKMMEPDSCSPSDILKNGDDLVFDSQMVERMEFLILGALKWRMRSITPFAFIKFFVSLFKFKGTSNQHHQVLKDRATEIIFKAQIEPKVLYFKPSIIAASALLCASHELYPLQFSSFKASISSCSYVNQEDFAKCYGVIEEVVMDGYESMLSCKTPINVLDLDYSSSEDTNNKRTQSEEEDDDEKRGLKRLKISALGKNPFQLS